jgi:general secretion pathway protein C
MLARLSAFVIWALVAATAVFWGLRLFVPAAAAPSFTVAVGDSGVVRADLSRLLGAAPASAPAAAIAVQTSSRFRLLGIVAPKYAAASAPASHGVALIAVDGKMPKAYAIGSRVDGDLVLQSVSLRTVSIGPTQGAAALTLELPLPTMAATGTLPVATGGGPVPPAVPTFVPQPMAPQPVAPRGVPQPVPAPTSRPGPTTTTQETQE